MARGYDYESYEETGRGAYQARRWPHSGVGIASFIAGIVALLMIFAAIGVIIVVFANTAKMPKQPPERVLALIGLLFIGAGLIALIGTGLGIGGCCQTDRKKVFAILGLVINGLILLVVVGIMLVGLFSASQPSVR